MRRVLVNFLLAFFVLPLLLFIADYIRIEIVGDRSSYSGSFVEYYKNIKWKTTFIITPFFYILFVLLPYNIVYIKYLDKRTSVLKKNFFLFGFQIFWITVFFTNAGVWSAGLGVTLGVLMFVLSLSYLFTLILHYSVDKREFRHDSEV